MTNIFLRNSKLWRKWGESDRERKKNVLVMNQVSLSQGLNLLCHKVLFVDDVLQESRSINSPIY